MNSCKVSFKCYFVHKRKSGQLSIRFFLFIFATYKQYKQIKSNILKGNKMYTEENKAKIQEHIVEEITKGRSLKKILEEDEGMPSRMTIYQWLNPESPYHDTEFSYNYTHAREESADLDADKMEEIIEKVMDGTLSPDRARVAGDLLKWTAGKKKPKKYGNKLDITSANEQLTNQVTVFQLPTNGRDIEDNE